MQYYHAQEYSNYNTPNKDNIVAQKQDFENSNIQDCVNQQNQQEESTMRTNEAKNNNNNYETPTPLPKQSLTICMQTRSVPPNPITAQPQIVDQQVQLVHDQKCLVVSTSLNSKSGGACRFCGMLYSFKTSYQIGNHTILLSIIILLLFFPLFWLPLTIDKCKDKLYHCNKCGKILNSIQFTIC